MAASADKSDATDADYYVLADGGRPGTNIIWLLDLNNFAGYRYNLVANPIGVNAPNSGHSVPVGGNSVSYQYPMYVGLPAVANPAPIDPPVLTSVYFNDSAGVDYSISPAATPAVQDNGVFFFTSDVSGTYAVGGCRSKRCVWR